MDLCAAITAAREDCGLSQRALAERLDVPRLKITRLEAGVGSVELLLQVMPLISLRMLNVGKGETISDQLRNARIKRGWSEAECARRSGIDERTVKRIETGNGSVSSLIKLLGVLAPKAKRQQNARAIWSYDRSKSAETDSRFTPKPFIDEIVSAFGPIALDPCSHPKSPVQATRKIMLPEDGLKADWTSDGLVWINPPFSNLDSWLKRANVAWRDKEVTKMIFLLPAARLDLRTYFDETAYHAETLILGERLKFTSVANPEGTFRAPFALTIVAWGCDPKETERFMHRVPSIRIPMRSGV